MHPAAGDAREDDARGGPDGDAEVDGDEGREGLGLCGCAREAVEDEGGVGVRGGLGRREGLGEGGRVDEVVDGGRGGGGFCFEGAAGECEGVVGGGEEPPPGLELVEDEAQDHVVWDEGAGAHGGLSADTWRSGVRMAGKRGFWVRMGATNLEASGSSHCLEAGLLS